MSFGRIRTSLGLVRIQTHPTFSARTVVRARHRVVMISPRACTAIRDNMPGGLLDTSFLVGGMGMHACTVEGVET